MWNDTKYCMLWMLVHSGYAEPRHLRNPRNYTFRYT
jgi:hypothetical protein